jgi:phosphonate transport system substrate-binding protein
MQRRQLLLQLSGFICALGSTQLLKGCQTEDGDKGNEAIAPPLEELHFGILTIEPEADLIPKWEPFLADLSAAVGLPVKPFFAHQYSSLVESMRSGVIQIAWLGGKTYIEAVTLADAQAFALTVSDTGEKGYYAHLLTHGDRPWLKQVKDGEEPLAYLLKDGQDITFAFNDINSTSGYLVPMYYLFAKNQIDPLKHFKNVAFLGSHEETVLAVAEQRFDVVTNNSEALERFKDKFADKAKAVQIIWTSPLIPADPIAYTGTLPEDLKEKTRNFFYGYKNQAVLNTLDWSGFEPATDKDWDPIRELEIGKQMLEIEDNKLIGEEEKKNILLGLQERLDALHTDGTKPSLP